MAAEDEGRTEEASQYRLEKARKEGRVAKSQEISSSLVLIFTIMILIFLAKWIFSECIILFRFFFNRVAQENVLDPDFAEAFFLFFLKIIIPVGAVAIVAGFLANIIQNKGFIFSTKPLQPNFKNIVPNFGSFFKKTLFSGRGLFNIAKQIIKVVIICLVGFLYIKSDIFVLVDIIDNGQILSAIGMIAKMALKILITIAILFLLISIPDYFVQRKEFMESMKMSKYEVKQEYKELEGDPEVKSRLQQMQREIMTQNIPRAVAESDVVITNPTHFSIALRYDSEKEDAPRIMAKGEDEIAFLIRRLADENNIPRVENKAVARSLYTDSKVGDIIPSVYWEAISLIYAQISKYSK